MPSVTRDNIGRCLPSDLLGAINLFNGKYPDED
jgi:hypothetical protein